MHVIFTGATPRHHSTAPLSPAQWYTSNGQFWFSPGRSGVQLFRPPGPHNARLLLGILCDHVFRFYDTLLPQKE